MTKKETTSIQDLMTVIKILEESSIAYWIDGGWGVDILAGKQTRPHRDIDVDFDAQYTEKLLSILAEHGYQVDTDWAPVRIELYSEKLGYLDIHPFILHEDGTSKQADLEGGYYEFEADFFGQIVEPVEQGFHRKIQVVREWPLFDSGKHCGSLRQYVVLHKV